MYYKHYNHHKYTTNTATKIITTNALQTLQLKVITTNALQTLQSPQIHYKGHHHKWKTKTTKVITTNGQQRPQRSLPQMHYKHHKGHHHKCTTNTTKVITTNALQTLQLLLLNTTQQRKSNYKNGSLYICQYLSALWGLSLVHCLEFVLYFCVLSKQDSDNFITKIGNCCATYLECEVIQINAGSLGVYLPTKVHLQTTKDLFESSII